MICSNCGIKLSDEAVFCHECGHKLHVYAGQNVNGMNTWANANRNAKSGNTSLKMGLTILLSVLIVLFGIGGSMIFHIHNATNKSAIEDLAEEMEWDELRVGFLIKGEGKRTTLTEYIASGKESCFMMMGDLEEGDIEDLLHEEYIEEFLANKANDYVQDVFSKNGKGKVKAKEIADLMDDNKKDIIEFMDDRGFNSYNGWHLDDGNIEYVKDALKYMDIDEFTDLSELREENSTPFTLLRVFASKWMMAILFVLAFAMSVGIFFIQDKKMIAFRYIGINCMILGGINMLVGLLNGVLVSCMNGMLPFGDEFWELVLLPVKFSGLCTGGIVAVIGVALFLITLKTRKVRKAFA